MKFRNFYFSIEKILKNLSSFKEKSIRRSSNKWTKTLYPGADLGFFLGGGAPLRNYVTDW